MSCCASVSSKKTTVNAYICRVILIQWFLKVSFYNTEKKKKKKIYNSTEWFLLHCICSSSLSNGSCCFHNLCLIKSTISNVNHENLKNMCLIDTCIVKPEIRALQMKTWCVLNVGYSCHCCDCIENKGGEEIPVSHNLIT